MKKTLAIIEKDENGYGIYTPDLKDTVISGSGMSVEDAKADFLTAYKEVLDSYTENGEAVPDELKDLAFEYKYDVSAFFNQFDCINASKFAALGFWPFPCDVLFDDFIYGCSPGQSSPGLFQFMLS